MSQQRSGGNHSRSYVADASMMEYDAGGAAIGSYWYLDGCWCMPLGM
jgi:hypothetical protein